MLLLLPAGQRSQMLQRGTTRGPCWCGSLRVVLRHEEGPWRREDHIPMVLQHQPETRQPGLRWAGDTGKLGDGWISGGRKGSWGTEERREAEVSDVEVEVEVERSGSEQGQGSRVRDCFHYPGTMMKAHSLDCIPALTFSRSQNTLGRMGWRGWTLEKTKDEEKTFTFTVLADVIRAEQLPTCLTNPAANINKRVSIYILNVKNCSCKAEMT